MQPSWKRRAQRPPAPAPQCPSRPTREQGRLYSVPSLGMRVSQGWLRQDARGGRFDPRGGRSTRAVRRPSWAQIWPTGALLEPKPPARRAKHTRALVDPSSPPSEQIPAPTRSGPTRVSGPLLQTPHEGPSEVDPLVSPCLSQPCETCMPIPLPAFSIVQLVSA